MTTARYRPTWDLALDPLVSCKLCLGEFPLEQMTTITQCQCVFCTLVSALKSSVHYLVNMSSVCTVVCMCCFTPSLSICPLWKSRIRVAHVNVLKNSVCSPTMSCAFYLYMWIVKYLQWILCNCFFHIDPVFTTAFECTDQCNNITVNKVKGILTWLEVVSTCIAYLDLGVSNSYTCQSMVFLYLGQTLKPQWDLNSLDLAILFVMYLQKYNTGRNLT